MSVTQTNNNSVAMVAIIVVGLLIAGAGVLYYTGAFSGGNTTVIEAPAEKESGLSLKFDNTSDGIKTEITTD